MALLKRRPEIGVLTTAEVVAGNPVVGEVLVDAKEAVPIEWLRVWFVGTEQGAVGSGKSRTSKEVELVTRMRELTGEQELAAGSHRFAFSIPTPSNLPPSYEGAEAFTRYELQVRISIPWWPDAKKRYQIQLRPTTAAADHPGKPLVLSSRVEGPSSTDPHMELSLGQSVLAPGDRLRGALALTNVEHNRYHRMVLELHTIEEVTLGRYTRGVTKRKQFKYSIDVSDTGEGQQYNFSLSLPDTMAPTFVSRLWKLTWEVRIRLDIRWALDLKFALPVPVVSPQFRNPAAAQLPPAVGSPRVEAAWVQVAESLGLDLVQSSLRADFDGVALHVFREHRGSRGLHLVGTLRFPDLHLDLSIAPGTGVFRKTARQGIQLGNERFDEAHEVRCRDEGQALAFFKDLLEPLFELETVTMDDDTLVTELRNNGTISSDLEHFAVPLVSLAKRVAAARRKIPPPEAAAASVPVWRDLASKLDGTLDPSSMIVTGRFRGLPVEVETTWTPDGKPAEIATTVGLSAPIDAALEGDYTPTLVMESLPDEIPSAARPLFESLSGLVETLRIRRNHVAAATPWLAKPHDALSLVRTLAEIADVLSPGVGPYR